MEITAHDGKFFVSAFGLGDWKYEWNKKDGSLSIWGERKYTVSVTTYRGTFIEAVDESGNVLCDGGDGDWFHAPITKKKTTLRFRTLPDPELTSAQIKKARRETTVHVVDQERHNGGPFEFGESYTDGSLLKVLKSLEKIRNGIPAKYRAKARCEINSTSGYEGSHYAHIEVTYRRPETDAEVIERVKIERERARIERRKDEAKLAQLEKKLNNANV